MHISKKKSLFMKMYILINYINLLFVIIITSMYYALICWLHSHLACQSKLTGISQFDEIAVHSQLHLIS